MFNTQGWVFNTQGWVFNTQGWVFNTQGWVFNAQGWLNNTQGWLDYYFKTIMTGLKQGEISFVITGLETFKFQLF